MSADWMHDFRGCYHRVTRKEHSMTSTTSLKLPDELKAQIADTAKRRGKTAHALMVESLQQAMDEARVDDEFYREAIEAYEETVESNICYSHEDIKNWTLSKLRGENPSKPTPRAYDPKKPMRPDILRKPSVHV
jgi:predicted transcriptional regulator